MEGGTATEACPAAMSAYGLFSGHSGVHLFGVPGQQVRAQNSRGPQSAFVSHTAATSHETMPPHLGRPLLLAGWKQPAAPRKPSGHVTEQILRKQGAGSETITRAQKD